MSKGRHTPATLRRIAEHLRGFAKEVEKAAKTVEDSGVELVRPQYESSREDAKEHLNRWLHSLQDCAKEAKRLGKAKSNGK